MSRLMDERAKLHKLGAGFSLGVGQNAACLQVIWLSIDRCEGVDQNKEEVLQPSLSQPADFQARKSAQKGTEELTAEWAALLTKYAYLHESVPQESDLREPP